MTAIEIAFALELAGAVVARLAAFAGAAIFAALIFSAIALVPTATAAMMAAMTEVLTAFATGRFGSRSGRCGFAAEKSLQPGDKACLLGGGRSGNRRARFERAAFTIFPMFARRATFAVVPVVAGFARFASFAIVTWLAVFTAEFAGTFTFLGAKRSAIFTAERLAFFRSRGGVASAFPAL